MQSGRQITAARDLLGWSADKLAQVSGLNRITISNIETGKADPKESTLKLIKDTIYRSGVEITEKGVHFVDDATYSITGDNWYIRLLDDVSVTLDGQDDKIVRIAFAKDSLSSEEVINKLRQLKREGIRFKITCEYGDTDLLDDVQHYRWVLEGKFVNWITITYGDKTAITQANEAGAIVNFNKQATQANKLQFDIAWDLLEQPTKNTGHVRI